MSINIEQQKKLEKQLITHIQSDHPKEVASLYHMYKDAFLKFGQRFQLDNHALLEIYHDALIEMRKHAISGRLETVSASFKTYLFSIGKFKIYKYLKERDKSPLQITKEIPDEETIDISLFDEQLLTENQLKLQAVFKDLGKKCQRMLINFYHKELSINEIMVQENYESENTVRSQKSRCLKTLKSLFKK